MKDQNQLKKKRLRQKKPLWVKINKNDFDLLLHDVYNNLNNNQFKTTVEKKTCDLKSAKRFLVKKTTQKN